MYLKQRFGALGDDGNNYEICVYGRRVDSTTFAGRSSVEGLPRLVTGDGLSVNRLSKGRYKVVQTGVILESTDPDSF